MVHPFAGLAVMQCFRRILRTCLILALIPLTVLSGRVVPGCICSDGHFELFCRGSHCDTDAPRDTRSSCGGCGKCCQSRSTSVALKSCCGSDLQPGRATGCPVKDCSDRCCHPLTLSPMVPARDFLPQHDVEQREFEVPVTVPLRLPDGTQVISVHVVDSGPQRERLKMIQSLLI